MKRTRIDAAASARDDEWSDASDFSDVFDEEEDSKIPLGLALRNYNLQYVWREKGAAKVLSLYVSPKKEEHRFNTREISIITQRIYADIMKTCGLQGPQLYMKAHSNGIDFVTLPQAAGEKEAQTYFDIWRQKKIYKVELIPQLKQEKPTKILVIGAGSVGSELINQAAEYYAARRIPCEILIRTKNPKDVEITILDLNKKYGQREVAIFAKIAKLKDIADVDAIVFLAGIRAGLIGAQDRAKALKYNFELINEYGNEIRGNVENKDVLLVVVANPVETMAKLLQQVTQIPASQVVGSGTWLDTKRYRRSLSDELDAKGIEGNLEAMVIGNHNAEDMVFLRDSITVKGFPLKDFAEEFWGSSEEYNDALDRIEREVKSEGISKIRPDGTGAKKLPAASAFDIVTAYLGQEDKKLSAAVYVPPSAVGDEAKAGEGYYGIDGPCYVALPLQVTQGKIEIDYSQNIAPAELAKLHEVAARAKRKQEAANITPYGLLESSYLNYDLKKDAEATVRHKGKVVDLLGRIAAGHPFEINDIAELSPHLDGPFYHIAVKPEFRPSAAQFVKMMQDLIIRSGAFSDKDLASFEIENEKIILPITPQVRQFVAEKFDLNKQRLPLIEQSEIAQRIASSMEEPMQVAVPYLPAEELPPAVDFKPLHTMVLNEKGKLEPDAFYGPGSAKPKRIFLIGTGDVASALLDLMTRDIANKEKNGGLEKCEIVIYDRDPNRAEEFISNHFYRSGRNLEVRKALNLGEMKDSDVVMIAAGTKAQNIANWSPEKSLKYHTEIAHKFGRAIGAYAPNALVVSITDPAEHFATMLQQASNLPPQRIIGASTNLDSLRYSALISDEITKRRMVGDIKGMVIGTHSEEGMIFLRENVTIGNSLGDRSLRKLLVQNYGKKDGFDAMMDDVEQKVKTDDLERIMAKQSARNLPAQAMWEIAENYLYAVDEKKMSAVVYVAPSADAPISGPCFLGLPVKISSGRVEVDLEICSPDVIAALRHQASVLAASPQMITAENLEESIKLNFDLQNEPFKKERAEKALIKFLADHIQNNSYKELDQIFELLPNSVGEYRFKVLPEFSNYDEVFLESLRQNFVKQNLIAEGLQSYIGEDSGRPIFCVSCNPQIDKFVAEIFLKKELAAPSKEPGPVSSSQLASSSAAMSLG